MKAELKFFLYSSIALAMITSSCDVFAAPAKGAAKSPTTTTAPAGPQLYRYRNAKGSIVTAYLLPPEQATKGYEIISLSGDVLKVVRPVLTEEEKKEMLDAIEEEKFDKALLLKYGSLAELMKAQKRKTAEMDAKMTILKVSLINVSTRISDEQKKAAVFERQGKPVPEVMLASLESLYLSQDRIEGDIQLLEKDAVAEKIRFEYEVARYKKVKQLR